MRARSGRAVALDWSGARQGAARKIWWAEAEDGQLTALVGGLDRAEAQRRLLARLGVEPDLRIGLDFAFGLPQAALVQLGWEGGPALWQRRDLEELLRAPVPPFWGWPGSRAPAPAVRWRATEVALRAAGWQVGSALQLRGPGSVGTGSLRGVGLLAALQAAGAEIWPWTERGRPARGQVMEIWPRQALGRLVKRSAEARAAWVAARGWPEPWASQAAASDDALDAAVAAEALSRAPDNLPPLHPLVRQEGWIFPLNQRDPGR